MRGKRAKELRRIVYGYFSPRWRQYGKSKRGGAVVANSRRRQYQLAKKLISLLAWSARPRAIQLLVMRLMVPDATR